MLRLVTILSALVALSLEYSLNYKMDKLQKQLSKDGSVLQLDSQAFKLYTEEPRNYSLVVMFTALDSSVGCEPCWKLKPEFDLVAADFYSKVGRQSEEGKKLFFCSLDFMNGRDAFLSTGLKSAPIVMHFGPTDGEGSKATPDRWDIQDITAEDLAEWVKKVAKIDLRFKRPLNYQKLVFNLVLAAFALVTVKLAYDRLSFLFRSSLLWSVLTLFFIVNMCAGFMYNQIRHTPYSGVNDKGKLEVIRGEFQNQYSIETQIVAGLYATLAGIVVMLAKRVPAIKDPNTQRIAAYAGLLGLLLVYSMLINVFKVKNGGYPFRLLL